MSRNTAYYGKYRAVVVDLDDPEKRGRIRVTCPAVLGEGKSPWCEACTPFTRDSAGDFCLPKIGDTVWIEFEAGNPMKPIYTGNWWKIDSIPTQAQPYEEKSKVTRVIEFDGVHIVMNKDSITMTVDGSVITMTKDSVDISSKVITVNGTESITLTGGGAVAKLIDGKIYLN